MPIPKPRPDEKQANFISRCIRQLTKEDPDRDRAQIAAICFGQWRNRKKAKMEKEDYKRDEDGHYIIAESVPVIFNSEIIPETESADDEEKVDEESQDAGKKE